MKCSCQFKRGKRAKDAVLISVEAIWMVEAKELRGSNEGRKKKARKVQVRGGPLYMRVLWASSPTIITLKFRDLHLYCDVNNESDEIRVMSVE